MKNKKLKRIIITVIAAAALLYMFPFYHYIDASSLPTFSASDANKLFFRGFPTDWWKARAVIQNAENAFSDLSCSEQEAREKYGLLSKYCYTSDMDPEVVSEKHTLKVWSVRLNTLTSEYSGYIWVCYTERGFDQEGNMITGSFKVPALWCLDKIGDTWKVVKIIENV